MVFRATAENAMLLSYHKLKQKVVGRGVITNVTEDMINGSSIDITLGKTILREGFGSHCVSLRDNEPLSMKSFVFGKDNDHFDLFPGDFILAQSVQVFNLPLHMSAEYKLKSSMARSGLNHLNAGWCDAGWSGSVLTLELVNCSSLHTIRLHEGDRIGQVVFFEHVPVPAEVSYKKRGRYNNDSIVSGVKEKLSM